MTKGDKDNISKKIQKLLALSKSSNQHEAELAMKRANDLMAKHQIAEAEVLAHVSVSDINTEYVNISGKRKQWVIILACACAKVFDSKVLQLAGGYSGTNFIIIGRPEDIKSTQFLFEHLLKSWESMVESAWKQFKEQTLWEIPRGHAVKFKTAHGAGYAYALMERAKEMVAAREVELKEASQTAALVPINTGLAVQNKIGEDFGKLGKSQAPSATSKAGYETGTEHGKNVPMGGGVEGHAGYLS